MGIPRAVVQITDVKLATLLGDPADGVGYISLGGFNANAGREVRGAILGLQRLADEAAAAAAATAGPGAAAGAGLRGLVLDLRGNPGGLLNSAVDVASLLVPKGSDIVSAKGRGFPGVLYRSSAEPILDPARTRLAILVNGQTASAAEIVSGAVQDLDVGVIVGADRTYGKGLVQNVETLPFNTALKYTVAKYYTPSGRCIQSTNYQEGGSRNGEEDGRYKATKVSDSEKKSFRTINGREVKDGGGVAVDFKVASSKASVLELTLLRSGAYTDFAAEWSRDHQLSNNLDVVDEATYSKFKSFVMERQRNGDIKLEAAYSSPLETLKKSLKASGYKGTSRELDSLRTSLVREIEQDFQKHKKDIEEDLGQTILSRYLPESMLLNIAVKRDKQVDAAVELVRQPAKFDNLLGRAAGGPNGGGKVAGAAITAIAANGDIGRGDFGIVSDAKQK